MAKYEQKIVDNPLRKFSCLKEEEKKPGGQGNQWYADKALKQQTSPFGQAPYRDFAQWQHNENKPWNYKRAPDPSLKSTTARRRWFQVLTQLDQEHDWKLGLYDPKNPPKEAAQGKKINADLPSWKYIPKQKPTHRLPIWSTKVHALKQWAKQQTDSYTRERLWQPPLLAMMPPDAHRRNLFSQQLLFEKELTTPATAETKAKVQPTPCNCSTPILLDPCSLPTKPLKNGSNLVWDCNFPSTVQPVRTGRGTTCTWCCHLPI
jgi:hypothetical protein